MGEYLDLIIFYLVFIIVCIFGGVIWYKRRKRINSMTPEEKDKYLRDKAIKTQRKAEKSAARQEALQKHTETAKEVSQKLKDTQEHIHSALATKCPRCGSKDLQIIGKHRKNFSVGKAVGGTILAGGVGSAAGFAGKNTKKLDVVCLHCGKQFKVKKFTH